MARALFSEMIRVVLPHHLRTLARVTDEVQVDLNGGATVKSVIDAIEAKYPALRGTIRDHDTLKRRSLVRFRLDVQYSSDEFQAFRHARQSETAACSCQVGVEADA